MSHFSRHPFFVSLTGAAPYMFDQPSHPSLFRSDDERPRWTPMWRWWEGEVKTALFGWDFVDVKRTIRFGLFPDEQLPRKALQIRPERFVNDFLSGLIRPQEQILLSNLSHVQKVEEIIKRCNANYPPQISWGWLPTRKDSDMDSLAIARAIDTESHLHFTRISFDELVRYTLGYPAARVEWFLQQHTAFYVHLLDHLNAYPEETIKYAEVENHLRGRSPFAYRAVARALQSVGLRLDLPNTAPSFEFFAVPIQRLFKEVSQSLGTILKVLCLLEVRFERTYLHPREMTWSRPFSVAFSFLEDAINSISPTEFAVTLNTTDERAFAALVEGDIFDEALANRLAIRWETLSLEVWECCRALPDELERIQGCLQPLLLLRNYHSLTAILSGLHKYSVSESSSVDMQNGTTAVTLPPVLPLELVYLLEPSQNYTAYRQQFHQAEGIPFLIPHLNEYHQRGDPVLQYLYAKLKDTIPQL
ncbi:hypothetical protein BJX99DRAFT_266909 [Aspergillus californicus]